MSKHFINLTVPRRESHRALAGDVDVEAVE